MNQISKGRKKQYIKKITTNDKEMLRAFRNCGRLTAEQLKNDLGVADRRVLNFCRDGYVEKKRLLNPQTKTIDLVYQLSDKGRDAVESSLNLQHCYKSSGGRHDLEVARKYLSLTKDQRSSWVTESELKERELAKYPHLQEAYDRKEISTSDGAYTNLDGRQICFEVVTRNYSKAEIEAKESFATGVGMELEISKI